MPDDSRQLIERAATRDTGAIEALLERFLPTLHAYVRMRAGPLVRGQESCADLVQSVCREVLSDLSAFEYRGETPFKHWLFQRAYRKILDRRDYYTAQKRDVRRQLRPVGVGGDESEPAAGALLEGYRTVCTPSKELMAREALERVEAAIDALPEDQRTAIALHRLVGLTVPAISEEMHRSEGAVRNLIYRGLARIGLSLADDNSQS